MSILIDTASFTLDSAAPNMVKYVGPGHTFSAVNALDLSRVYPKAGKNGDRGVARPDARFEQTVVVNAVTGETRQAILRLSGSLPVGITEADILALVLRCQKFLETAEGKAVFTKLDINH